MKFLFTNKVISKKLTNKLKGEYQFESIENHSLFIDNTSSIFYDNSQFSIVEGYLKDLNIELKKINLQTLSALNFIQNQWPPGNNITGSFSGFSYNKMNKNLIIFNDVIGTYPIYYWLKGDNVIISNSIILIGAVSNEEIDSTGVFQRAVGPYFMNFGSRTIIQNCKRLLPGEKILIKPDGNKLKFYDNDLYKNINNTPSPSPEYFFETLKTEIKYLLEGENEINIALSAGLDSRILFGAIPKNKDIISHTYGDKGNYENKIASRLSKIQNAKHFNYFNPKLYFPTKKLLEFYTKKTEALRFCSWLEILEQCSYLKNERPPILLGDMCEAIVGRNIKTFSSSSFQKQNFLRFNSSKSKFPFTNSTEEYFHKWKCMNTKFMLSWHGDNWFKRLNLRDKKTDIYNNSVADLNEVFDRIQSHEIPFNELYDEIFSWFTKSRIVMSQQILICNNKFNATSPSMSNQLMKLVSNIHPNFRLNNRFVNKLFLLDENQKKLGSIPTSQAPLVPQNYPEYIKMSARAIRSIIDDFFIKRLMKNKDPKMKYRLFKSLNWIDIYRTPGNLKKLESYYYPNKLTEPYAEIFLKLAKKRKDLDSWPFSNVDIISGAALNTELNLISQYKSNS